MTNDEIVAIYAKIFLDEPITEVDPATYKWGGLEIEFNDHDGMWALLKTYMSYSYDSGPDVDVDIVLEHSDLSVILNRASQVILADKANRIYDLVQARRQQDEELISEVMDEPATIPF